VHPQARRAIPSDGASPFATGEVTGEVSRLIASLPGEMKRTELQAALRLKHEDHFREAFLVPALKAGLIEMTITSKPASRLQKYRLTDKGRAWLKSKKLPEGNA
jgi:ATP-dependent DNA helicase RecG